MSYIHELEQELEITDQLLEGYEQTLALIPPCAIHEGLCLPHIESWIERMVALEEEVLGVFVADDDVLGVFV